MAFDDKPISRQREASFVNLLKEGQE